jgi:TonB family protein
VRRGFMLFISTALCACGVAGQTATPLNATDVQPAVLYAGEGVVAPELLPGSETVTPPKKCEKVDGTAHVFVVVDSKGSPIESFFIHPIGNDLDKIVLNVVSSDRFRPGTHAGAPADVAITDEVKIQTCLVEQKDPSGQKSYSLRARSVPEQRIELRATPVTGRRTPEPTGGNELPQARPPIYRDGGWVTAPVALNSIEAEYSVRARTEKINGVCLITLIVDRHGMPQNPQMIRALEPSLDANALTAVARYRFTPAMKDGVPVPVRITVEVNFKLY